MDVRSYWFAERNSVSCRTRFIISAGNMFLSGAFKPLCATGGKNKMLLMGLTWLDAAHVFIQTAGERKKKVPFPFFMKLNLTIEEKHNLVILMIIKMSSSNSLKSFSRCVACFTDGCETCGVKLHILLQFKTFYYCFFFQQLIMKMNVQYIVDS